MNDILKLENINKTYYSLDGETLTLKDFSLNVKEGEFVSIIGTSGCGKSTILNIIASLDKEYQGKIKFDKKRTVGYMLQEDTLFNWLTVYENAILGLKIQNKLNKKNIDYVISLLKKYGLDEYINKYPSCLSGGMRQRVVCIQ